MPPQASTRRGPLTGFRILEIGAIGPGPFCAMLLADLGAEVIRVDRSADKATEAVTDTPLLARGRRSIALDLKQPAGLETLLRMVEKADGLVEGFRPGVTERLGFGPDACLARNPRLVYGRMTGWGQEGPLAKAAGHDINYIALSGALHGIGRAGERPVPPLNLVGDFGGGGMLLAFGMLAALLERTTSGQGQVVDAAMIDGAGLLMTMFFELVGAKSFAGPRGTNLLDGGAPFYDVYETADGQHVAFGALEPKFFAELVERLGLRDVDLARQNDPGTWPALRAQISAKVSEKTRLEWERIFAGSDACFAPVLDLREAPLHPQSQARQGFVSIGGVLQPAPAPRFSRTPAAVPEPCALPGQHGAVILAELGFAEGEIERLKSEGALLVRKKKQLG
jgi:alpha-methylacyl-CoA racemase